MKKDASFLQEFYDLYGYGVPFEPYPSIITTKDLAQARLIGHAVAISYGSHKEGEYAEYVHDFISRPAVYELGVPDGEQIEALLNVSETDLRDVVYFGDFLDLVFEDAEGAEVVIDGPGGLFVEPLTDLILIETDEGGKYAIVGYRVDRWVKG